MTRLENPGLIESIVGARRHRDDHIGRAVSVEQRVYILHSEECRDLFSDLRDCPFSRALDRGIEGDRWAEFMDQPVKIKISFETLKLVPVLPLGGEGE